MTYLCGEAELTNPEHLDVYARKLDVLNRGLSGYNTEWAIPVFEQVSWADFLIRMSKNGELNNHDNRSLPKRKNSLTFLLYAC